MTKPRGYHGLPTRQEVLDFIAASPTPVGKREIVKAFKVRPTDRVALKGLIKDIERTAPVTRTTERRLIPIDTLPEVVILEITGIDPEGDPICRLLRTGDARPDTAEPVLRLVTARGAPAYGVGQKILTRLRKNGPGTYQASPIRQIADAADHVLAVFEAGDGGGGRLTPTDRHNKHHYRVRPDEALGAGDGELVLAMPLPLPRLGLPHAQIIERIGRIDDPKAISLIAIHSHGIPVGFTDAALREAAAARPVTLGTRTDLRDIPLITIDGADARDFDDAVWAEPTESGGWHILVAIADVSWYVRPDSALDRAALDRGNSVYFPDRVVPMLPEALSNELCSLKPKVERACLAIHLWLDADGNVTRRLVVRGLMRSVARTTYEQVQAAFDGRPDEMTGPLLDPIIKPLYGAFTALDRARRRRGTLELDLPERRVVLNEAGKVVDVALRQRLDSHRLIEEFMIAANVAAAEALEAAKKPCMYRVHDTPSAEKLDALRTVLDSLSLDALKLAKGQVIRPQHFNRILDMARERPEAAMINELVLRSQAQAAYAPENLGHFGLSLERYAHFTSPIRRYADLLVHRALVAGLHLGEGGLSPVTPDAFAETGAQLSRLERRAALAERTAIDRYMVAFMADRRGAVFEARINGVTRFGLFVTVLENGADGLIPMAGLPRDYYHHDAAHHCLVGERSRRIYTLGDRLAVELVDVNPVAGGLTFRPVGDSGGTGDSPGINRMPKPIPGGKPLKPRTKIPRHRRGTARRP